MHQESRDKLKEAILLCDIHSQRMNFAWSRVEKHFPLTIDKYQKLQDEDLSFIDQIIFRFSKLQDSMGGKLFPSILETLGEEIKGLPFIDRLSKLEELNIITNADEWLLLRETRNIVTHEYPFVSEEVIEGLNLLHTHSQLINDIWIKIKTYISNRYPQLRE